jgi:hypothetical protein
MIQRPNAVGMVLCQQTIIEQGTGNVTLVNAFSRLTLATFPTPPQQFTVHTILTDGLGEMTLTVAVADLGTLSTIYRRSWRATFSDPLQERRLLARVTACSFPTPGRYQVSLLAEGEWVAQCLLAIRAKGGMK